MIRTIQKIFQEKKNLIEEWFSYYGEPLNDPVYCSLDIRNAGYKIGPVDANIFPGGWNNLCSKYRDIATEKFKKFLKKNYPEMKKILIIPENHTRNTYYLSNVKALQKLITNAGIETRIGTLNEELTQEVNEFQTSENENIQLEKIYRKGARLFTKNTSGIFDADLYVLNNDLSVGMPDILKNLEVPLNPTPLGGWYNRRKSAHFHCYKILAEMFATEIGIDPWLITPYFSHTEGIDFSKQKGLEKVAKAAADILEKTAKKFEEYGIKEKPYIFIKNDAGTYGMAVTSVDSTEEILNMNNDMRKKMNMGKGNIKVNDVIIQEGLPTTDQITGNAAEPVLYLMDNEIAGGFFRIHAERDTRQSLNTPGMTFTHLCLHEIKNYTNTYDKNLDLDSLTYVYHVIGRLASIATGYEIIGLKE